MELKNSLVKIQYYQITHTACVWGMKNRHSQPLIIEIKISLTFTEDSLSISVRNKNTLPFDLVIAFLGNILHTYSHIQK